MNKCLRCGTTETLTRSHVPPRFILRFTVGSLKRAYKNGLFQVHFLCEECRKAHKVLEDQLIKRKFLEISRELEALHAKFVGGPGVH